MLFVSVVSVGVNRRHSPPRPPPRRNRESNWAACPGEGTDAARRPGSPADLRESSAAQSVISVREGVIRTASADS